MVLSAIPSLLILLIVISFSAAPPLLVLSSTEYLEETDLFHDESSISSSLSSCPKAQAEKMIRSLNLRPSDHRLGLLKGLLETEGTTAAAGQRLVEKRFRLDGVAGDPGTSSVNDDLGHHAGYYKLPHAKDARMFYFFFESRSSKKDPVVIWLTGGPGCSSELALFYENGPFKIQKNLSLSWNDFGWDKASNLIYVDQPIGTGFSYSTQPSDDIPHDEKGVSDDLYDFLQAFFKEHPEYTSNDFYITGESYAGHYIPAFASRVRQGNVNKEGLHINLKGFAIGNGLTNPALQYPAYPDYALENNLITESDHKTISQMIPTCEKTIKLCATNGGDNACLSAYTICNGIFNKVLDVAGSDLNYYDIRKKCDTSLCYDFSAMETLLNQKSVRQALGVSEDLDFVSCSSTVYSALQADWMKNLEVGIPALLEDGIKLLVYAGDRDLICNWLGNSRWVHAAEWSGQRDFSSASTQPFTVDGAVAGELKSHGPLAFLKVHEAGHMVPMDQPKAALEMLRRWTHGNLAPRHHRIEETPGLAPQ